VILDTNAVSSLLTGDKQLAKLLAASDRHHLPIYVIAEYQFGLLGLARPKRLQSLFGSLEADSDLLFPDRETANVYASIRFELKAAGTPIPENDVWIAALARQFSLGIASKDPHFDRVAGIRRFDW
jgi:tRNA(fMet)-specific endonuclease VapC